MLYTITDGGIETALTDRLGQDLPEFAAFVLLDTEPGRDALAAYYRPFIELSRDTDVPLLVDTPTWRANLLWGKLLGYDAEALDRINADAVAFLRTMLRGIAPNRDAEVNGSVGPKFDDYVVEDRMSAEEAEKYHAPQIRALAEAGADRVTAVTVLDAAEGIGIVRAARGADIPVYVSFTLGDDGRLPDGTDLADSIAEVDRSTDGAAEAFLVNCAHPAEVEQALARSAGAPEFDRLHGFRLNAARHGDDGPGDAPADFARALFALRDAVPTARVFGGCCGTDTPHITALAAEIRSDEGNGR